MTVAHICRSIIIKAIYRLGRLPCPVAVVQSGGTDPQKGVFVKRRRTRWSPAAGRPQRRLGRIAGGRAIAGPWRRAAAAVVIVLAANAFVASGTPPVYAAPTNDPTCGTPINGTPAGWVGASSDGYALNVGGASELAAVWDPPSDTAQAAFPTAMGIDVVGANGQPARKVITTFGLTADRAEIEPRSGHVVSTDGAATFPAGTYSETPLPSSSVRLRDGTLFGVGFKPTAVPGATTTIYDTYRSTDEGRTWSKSSATFNLGGTLQVLDPTSAGRTSGSMLELADGTIVVSVYAPMTDGHRAQLMASSDGGRTFDRRGIMAIGTGGHYYAEPTVGQLPNGNLLSVIRHHVADEVVTPVYTTSIDGGATWAALADISISFQHGYDPFEDGGPVIGVNPMLTLMPNGVMVLSSGRPDNWVAISTNGLGTGWVGQLTYRNCPTTGARTHGSTGYAPITAVGSNRLAQFGDNCEMTWSCVTPTDSGFTIDKQTRVWRRFVDVLTPDTGKIDLATKYRLGKIGITTNMLYVAAGHPRTGVSAAFDGSTEYWSSAVRADGAGSYVIALDRAYDLTRIGLSLRNGRQSTGRIYASSDGVTWGSPIVTAANRTHFAMEYAPVSAQGVRFVKVEVDASATCEAELGAGCAFLNEIELYSTINSFENDTVNNRPRGHSNLQICWVSPSALDGNDSSRALRLVDNSTTAPATANWYGPATTTRTLEFRVNPVALANGFLFTVYGTAWGASVAAYHFYVPTSGAIARYVEATKTWQPVTASGLVPVGEWSTIRVSATTTSATLTVNGTTVATNVSPTNEGVTAFDGHGFSSAGTATTGDEFLIDDVLSAA